jgi:cytochrome c-type biogenesis protein
MSSLTSVIDSGSLLLAVPVAIAAGAISFASPCVLPLVPGYLSMVSGLSAAELASDRHRAAALAVVGAAGGGAVAGEVGPVPAAASVPAVTRPVLTGIGLFVGGFTLVFVALGAAASGIGRLLNSHEVFLSHLSGVVVIALGAVLLLSAAPAAFWTRIGTGAGGMLSRLTGERRIAVRPSTLGVWAAPVMGMAFAFAWTPCIGPVLGAVLDLAARNGTLAGGVLLLFAYSLGLGLPFVATGLAFERLTKVFARARRALGAIEIVAALILIVFGVLLLTDNVAWVSTQFSNLLTHLGLSRLTKS